MIYVITGPMFSGKTTELINLYNRFAGKDRCQMFSSRLDNRYSEEQKVCTHDGKEADARLVLTADELREAVDPETDIIFIDELHLIKGPVASVCLELDKKGKQIYVSGLDLDYLGSPFREMMLLMPYADTVLKKAGDCSVCGKMSRYSYRTSKDRKRLTVGAADKYEPRCREHFNPEKEPEV